MILTYTHIDYMCPGRLRLASMAKESEHRKNWYVIAQDHIERAAERAKITPEYVAGVLATTSPRASVKHNLAIAASYIRQEPVRISRATRSALWHFEETGEIRGPKTSAFFQALLGDPQAIALDTHMAAALGTTLKGLTSATRPMYLNAVADTADFLGWTPAETQAAVWSTVYRTRYGVEAPDYLLMEHM